MSYYVLYWRENNESYNCKNILCMLQIYEEIIVKCTGTDPPIKQTYTGVWYFDWLIFILFLGTFLPVTVVVRYTNPGFTHHWYTFARMSGVFFIHFLSTKIFWILTSFSPYCWMMMSLMILKLSNFSDSTFWSLFVFVLYFAFCSLVNRKWIV